MMQKIQTLIDSDPQLRALIPLPEVAQSICTPGLSLAQIMDAAFAGYADREAVGSRHYDVVPSGSDNRSLKRYSNRFTTLTYAQFQGRIHALANAWKSNPVHRLKVDERVCIFGFVSLDLTVIDFATAYVQATTVPLQTGTSNLDIDEVLDVIEPAVVAVSVSDLVMVAEHIVHKASVRSLIVFDCDAEDDDNREAFLFAQELLTKASSSIALVALGELEALGGNASWEHLPAHEEGHNRIASIVHSSGSGGKAKAAMVSERSIQYYWISLIAEAPPVIGVCLAPFSHLLGKGSLISVLRNGGTAYFTLAPDMSTLFEDIRIARPTFLSFFPRIIELIYQQFQNHVAGQLHDKKGSEEEVRASVMKAMGESFLGDRLCSAMYGGAKLSTAVKTFFAECFGVQLLDAYGSTEGGQVAVNGMVQSPPVLQYRLRDVPELGYYTTDQPYPRGEFCYKSVQAISGYYKAPEATANLFDDEGFICTGDIVEEYAPNHIAIIDRRNDVLKLSQGEYVAVGELGATFEGGSDVISQIYLYGNSQRSYLLAVVVPNPEVIDIQLGKSPTDEAVNTLVRSELHRVAQECQIKSFEVPRDFIIDWQAFSETNGLLTGLRKKIRPALKKKYGDRLESLYESLEQSNQEKRRKLLDSASGLTVLEKLIALLEVDLNIRVTDRDLQSTFYELGGDSLGAVLLARSSEELFSLEIPADQILSPAQNLNKLASLIDQLLSGGLQRPGFTQIHGKGANTLHAGDLQLSKFIDIKVLEDAADLPAPEQRCRAVLLTGANGFLGRFICLEWLQKLADKDGRLICLVRANDQAEARARLDAVYEGLDTELAERYRELAKRHLEVLAGDVGEYQFGLDDNVYRDLAMQIDRVVHVAALVNHRLSYADLFGANVLGTAEVIRLALTERQKAIDFVSTVAVNAFLDNRAPITEDSPLLESITLSDDYAMGYAASKWAAEQLLQRAHQAFMLPVNIFRGDMMLPHRYYRGQVNASDMFVRLLYSIIQTGLAPYSFYPLKGDGSKNVAHYDGLPVDAVATSVVASAQLPFDRNTDKVVIYNLSNYHRGDGYSLDTFVDWIAQAGYPITRVHDYQQWLQQFEQAHKKMSKAELNQSAFDIISAFSKPQSIQELVVQSDRFVHLSNQLFDHSGLPKLSQPYIDKCLRDMCDLGMIEPKLEQS